MACADLRRLPDGDGRLQCVNYLYQASSGDRHNWASTTSKLEDRIVLQVSRTTSERLIAGSTKLIATPEEVNREFPGATPWEGKVVTYGG
jgi:hypothetical protein